TIEELALITIQIATKFIFSIGWHTKKALRFVFINLIISRFV
ncbi:unnamed protein product, partial [Rotaria sp. Silwood2]